MPKLTIALEDSKRSHELSDERITIGRAPDNLIQIDDASVSSRHAQLSLVGERYQLKDLESTNGTRVNGARVKERRLADGDEIQVGSTTLRYEGP